MIDGLTLEAVERATAAGLHAAKQHAKNLHAITSGNYGGKLGPFHIRLRDVLAKYEILSRLVTSLRRGHADGVAFDGDRLSEVFASEGTAAIGAGSVHRAGFAFGNVYNRCT